MLTNKDPQAHTTCPYNPSHQILNFRMAVHLVKCKRNYPNMAMVSCPYNATHQVPVPELKHHMEYCDNRVEMDSYLYVSDNVNRNRFPILSQNNFKDDNAESWDDDNDVESYNPEEAIKNKMFLRKLDVQSSATRRNFRLDERQRHNKLSEEPGCEQMQPSIRRPEAIAKASIKSARTVDVEDPDFIQQKLENTKIVKKVTIEKKEVVEIEEKQEPIRPLSQILKTQKPINSWASNLGKETKDPAKMTEDDFPALGGGARKKEGSKRFGTGRGRGNYK